jgi:hypothetical protein
MTTGGCTSAFFQVCRHIVQDGGQRWMPCLIAAAVEFGHLLIQVGRSVDDVDIDRRILRKQGAVVRLRQTRFALTRP